MNNVCIVYESRYDGNTEDVVTAVSRSCPVDLVNLNKEPFPDLSAYKIIVLASGIYRGRMYKALHRLVKHGSIDKSCNTYILFTSGLNDPGSSESLEKLLKEKGYTNLGVSHCPAYSSALRFRLCQGSGVSRGHPKRMDVIRIVLDLRAALKSYLRA